MTITILCKNCNSHGFQVRNEYSNIVCDFMYRLRTEVQILSQWRDEGQGELHYRSLTNIHFNNNNKKIQLKYKSSK